eukprot:Em0023g848a
MYQNLQRWSVAHCELQNSSVMLSLYVSASVVQSPSCNLCDGQGYVVLFEQASNTFYVTMDTVYAAAITAAIVPLLTMKVYFEGFPSTSSRYGIATPYSMSPDGFDAVSVQNVGSTYIIVSWDLPTDSNGILINFSLYCNGALVLQSRPQALHSSWNVVLGVISAAASLPSVLDDKKLLTLPNGERVALSPNFSEDLLSLDMIFEQFLMQLRNTSIDEDEKQHKVVAGDQQQQAKSSSPDMQMAFNGCSPGQLGGGDHCFDAQEWVEVADQRHQRDVQSESSGMDALDTSGQLTSTCKPNPSTGWDVTLNRHQLDYVDISPEDTHVHTQHIY